MYPTITMSGSIVRESIDFRFSQGGKAFCRFRIKVTQRKKDGNTWVDAEPIWQSVVCFDRLAERFADTFEDGDTVIVHGRLEPNVWTDRDNNERRDLNLVADLVGASLEWAAWTKRDDPTKSVDARASAPANDGWASTPSDEPPF